LEKKGGRCIVYAPDRQRCADLQAQLAEIPVFESFEEALSRAFQNSNTSGFLTVSLECPVCANGDFPGQVVNRDRVEYFWTGDEVLPRCKDQATGAEIELYRIGPIICNDCLMNSFYYSDFTVIAGEHRLPSLFNGDIKNLIMRTTNRRRTLLQKAEIDPTAINNDQDTRTDHTLEYLYRLSMDCLGSVSFDRSINRFFENGLSHFLAYHFMPQAEKDHELLAAAYDGFSEAIKNPHPDLGRVCQSYYFLEVLSFMLNRQRESIPILERFAELRNSNLENPGTARIIDFWIERTNLVHQREIRIVAAKLA